MYTGENWIASPAGIDGSAEPWNAQPVDLKALGQRLRDVRDKSGVQMGVAAEKAGVSKSIVTQWQRGEGNPTLKNLDSYVRELNAELVVYIHVPHESRRRLELATPEAARVAALIDAEEAPVRRIAVKLVDALPRLLSAPLYRRMVEALTDGAEEQERLGWPFETPRPDRQDGLGAETTGTPQDPLRPKGPRSQA